MSDPIRIVLADDHPLFREGVAMTLNAVPDFEVVGQAQTGEEAYELVGKLLPDIVLLDITMPGIGGVVAAQRITASWPISRIVMLTVSEDQDDLMKLLKAGVRGYVLKGVSASELIRVVRMVAKGDVYISPSLAGTILFEMTQPNDVVDPLTQLTERERQILQLVTRGMTNREIGESLHLAEKTIKHYMTNLLQKLHVRSRVEAALLAQQYGVDNIK